MKTGITSPCNFQVGRPTLREASTSLYFPSHPLLRQDRIPFDFHSLHHAGHGTKDAALGFQVITFLPCSLKLYAG